MTINSTDLNAILTRLLDHPDQLDDVKRTLQSALAKPTRAYRRVVQDEDDDLFDNVPV